MKKALITGTDGFIGGNLRQHLNNTFSITEINEDIFDKSNWVDELKSILYSIKPDVIFHVGACSDTLEKDVNYMMTRNYEFSKELAYYIFNNDIPLIYSSSAANYGTNGLYPSNLYGWSKYITEELIIQMGGIGLRYFNVYGPGEEHKGRMASVAYQMMSKFKNGEEVKLFPGNPKRDFVYVKDVIDANIFAYENFDSLNYSYYDVGSGISRSFEDVLNILKIPFTYHNEIDIPEGYQFFTQSDKNKWMTNWKPKFNLEDGLKDYFKI